MRARMLLTGALMRKTRRRVDRRPHPHHDCDKPDKPCRRHLRETPVYRIKIKRFSAGAASMDQHLSSPETRRCLRRPWREHPRDQTKAGVVSLWSATDLTSARNNQHRRFCVRQHLVKCLALARQLKSPARSLLPERPIPVLLLRANSLCFAARRDVTAR